MVLYILVYFRLGAILIFHLQIVILIICEQGLLLKNVSNKMNLTPLNKYIVKA